MMDEHLALLGALPGHGDHSAGQVDVVHVQPAQLRHPQPTPVQQLQHGVVAAIDRRSRTAGGGAGRLQELAQLGMAEDAGQAGVGCGS
jgi:hypothetical protein